MKKIWKLADCWARFLFLFFLYFYCKKCFNEFDICLSFCRKILKIYKKKTRFELMFLSNSDRLDSNFTIKSHFYELLKFQS